MEKIVIYNADETTQNALTKALARFELNELCSFESDGEQALKLKPVNNDSVRENDTFSKPYRLGEILDRLHWHIHRADKIQPVSLQIGPYTLDEFGYDLVHQDTDERIRMTNKEKDILIFLKTKNGAEVKREELLQAVWEYVHNVETHTLETHIYRLRQKIEKDPAAPEFLITTDKGYVLKG